MVALQIWQWNEAEIREQQYESKDIIHYLQQRFAG